MIGKILACILILSAVFVSGYGMALVRYDPDVRYSLHERGVLSFCVLDEDDRLRVCPLERRAIEFKTGGTFVYYRCSEKEYYIETINLSELSKRQLAESLSSAPYLKRVCNTEYGEVYRTSGTAK